VSGGALSPAESEAKEDSGTKGYIHQGYISRYIYQVFYIYLWSLGER
jgi:hypothetical protein